MIDEEFLKYEDVVKTIKEEIEGSEVCVFRLYVLSLIVVYAQFE